MLDLQTLRGDPERVRQAMRDKNLGDPASVDRVLDVAERRRAAQTELQEAQTELNASSKQIGQLMGAGKRDEAQALIQRTGELKERVKELEDEPRRLEDEQRRLLLDIPNLPHPSVPVGGEDANVIDAEVGDKPAFEFAPKPHWELAEQHGGTASGPIVDFERGAKVTGAGFPFYVGRGARLQRALIQLFLNLATEAGYTEVQPPLLVNEASGIGTGQLPDKEGQMYQVELDSLFLVPTSEVALVNYRRGEILDASDLPVRYTAYTPCFRREAGSYGKDVRGLNRLHQFDKVELVEFCHPDESYDRLEVLRKVAERAVQTLGLPYRRLVLATGDMGMTQTKTYDLEVWSAGQERWLEVSSVSNIEAYQARRANIRFRDENGKPQFVHTLNASALALPRIVAALLENNQQADGSVAIPEALRAYTGFDQIG
ncbi:MAG: serine--tRNA ligase [Bacteroidota bacterium]